MSTLTYMCQECNKFGTDSAEFKQILVRTDAIQFAYVLCNEHAKRLEKGTE